MSISRLRESFIDQEATVLLAGDAQPDYLGAAAAKLFGRRVQAATRGMGDGLDVPFRIAANPIRGRGYFGIVGDGGAGGDRAFGGIEGEGRQRGRAHVEAENERHAGFLCGIHESSKSS
jgi:hypothetical protein